MVRVFKIILLFGPDPLNQWVPMPWNPCGSLALQHIEMLQELWREVSESSLGKKGTRWWWWWWWWALNELRLFQMSLRKWTAILCIIVQIRQVKMWQRCTFAWRQHGAWRPAGFCPQISAVPVVVLYFLLHHGTLWFAIFTPTFALGGRETSGQAICSQIKETRSVNWLGLN